MTTTQWLFKWTKQWFFLFFCTLSQFAQLNYPLLLPSILGCDFFVWIPIRLSLSHSFSLFQLLSIRFCPTCAVTSFPPIFFPSFPFSESHDFACQFLLPSAVCNYGTSLFPFVFLTAIIVVIHWWLLPHLIVSNQIGWTFRSWMTPSCSIV